MGQEPQVFDIKKARCEVNGRPMTGIGSDGYGITPKAEMTVIPGLTGESGFNIDPSTMAEAVVSLNAASPENAYLRDIINKQMTGDQGPVSFEIIVNEHFIAGFGYKTKGMKFAMVSMYPEFKTDEKTAPVYEYRFVGYGYYEN